MSAIAAGLSPSSFRTKPRREKAIAFVESSDDLDPDYFEQKEPEWWQRILNERGRLERPTPDHLVWLDCVHARSFMQLPWREDACEIGDAGAAARRREQIKSLDPSILIVAPLLITRRFAAEGLLLVELGEAAWHRVKLDEHGDIPTVIAPDFDLEAEYCRWVYFDHRAKCSEPERATLQNVFNLNFLPEAELGGERGGPRQAPPTDRGGGPGKTPLDRTLERVHQQQYTSR